MSDVTTLELPLVSLDVDLTKHIPCSGTGHYTGYEMRLHGDPTQPAEWLVRQQCPSCGHCLNRPVCNFFKVHSMGPDRLITCSKCAVIDAADQYFTVLHRL